MPRSSFAQALRPPWLGSRSAPSPGERPGHQAGEARQRSPEGLESGERAGARVDEPDPDELEPCSGPGPHRGRRGGSGARAFEGEDERLDPLSRALAVPLSLRLDQAPLPSALPAAQPAAPSLDKLVERFLKRFAMSSSRGRGVAHLEIGEGTLGGGRVTIEAEGAQVRVVIEGASGEAVEKWASALEKRLVGKGLEASVELR